MKIGPDGSKEYKGAIDVLMKVCKQEGVFALWKGFWPYYFRLGPHTVSILFLRNFTDDYKKITSFLLNFRLSLSYLWSK